MSIQKTPRECEGCHGMFRMSARQRWHSKECHGKYAMEKPRHRFVCAYSECGIEYEKSAHQIGAGTGEFHSIACANRARALDETVRWERDAHGTGTEPLHVPGIGPCTEWTGGLSKDGYGIFSLANGRQIQSHKHAWQRERGLVPKPLFVCHHCDNRCCIRLSHLFLGTIHDNNRDRFEKGREAKGDASGARLHPESVPRGERSGMAKLTEIQVREIRRLRAEGWTMKSLATRFGRAQGTIYQVVTRMTWGHVAD